MNESTPPEPPSVPPPGVDPPPPSEPAGTPPSAPPPGAPPPPPPASPAGPGEPYPTRLNIDYPDRELNKTTTFFRIFVAIPILIVAAAIGGYYASRYDGGWGGGAAGGLLILPAALMIIFREKYPRWWFDFNVELLRFLTRIGAYCLLMNDEYPSTDEQQYVHLEVEYPDVERDLNRFMPLIKWLLALPHYVILFFLGIGAFFATIYAWFVILFTGRYPRDVFELIEGIIRWHLRVVSYVGLLTTDRYPPFSLGE